jgi:hypothetical protein
MFLGEDRQSDRRRYTESRGLSVRKRLRWVGELRRSWFLKRRTSSPFMWFVRPTGEDVSNRRKCYVATGASCRFLPRSESESAGLLVRMGTTRVARPM